MRAAVSRTTRFRMAREPVRGDGVPGQATAGWSARTPAVNACDVTAWVYLNSSVATGFAPPSTA